MDQLMQMMKKRDRDKALWIGILLLIVVLGCGPSQEEKASARLKVARGLLQGGDTTTALLQIDSVMLLHPKAAISVNAATNLRKEVLWSLFQRRQVSLDSARARIARLENRFLLTKGEFERTPRYVHLQQLPEENLSRSYLRADVTPDGELVLTSQYYGSGRLAHQRIRIYDEALEAFTDSVAPGSADVYHGSFLGTTWERVTFRGGREREVAPFIADHGDLRLKMAFLGRKSSYVVFLEDRDKKAIREAVELSQALRNKKAIEEEIARLNLQ
jgi:hypothetical protein